MSGHQACAAPFRQLVKPAIASSKHTRAAAVAPYAILAAPVCGALSSGGTASQSLAVMLRGANVQYRPGSSQHDVPTSMSRLCHENKWRLKCHDHWRDGLLVDFEVYGCTGVIHYVVQMSTDRRVHSAALQQVSVSESKSQA